MKRPECLHVFVKQTFLHFRASLEISSLSRADLGCVQQRRVLSFIGVWPREENGAGMSVCSTSPFCRLDRVGLELE